MVETKILEKEEDKLLLLLEKDLSIKEAFKILLNRKIKEIVVINTTEKQND